MTEVPVPTPNWVHSAAVLRVIDGDTFVARIDLGRFPTKIEATATIRVAGLNAPERKDAGGFEATSSAYQLLSERVVLATRKPDPRDPYGRVVADVWLEDGRSFAEAMIEAGHGAK